MVDNKINLDLTRFVKARLLFVMNKNDDENKNDDVGKIEKMSNVDGEIRKHG